MARFAVVVAGLAVAGAAWWGSHAYITKATVPTAYFAEINDSGRPRPGPPLPLHLRCPRPLGKADGTDPGYVTPDGRLMFWSDLGPIPEAGTLCEQQSAHRRTEALVIIVGGMLLASGLLLALRRATRPPGQTVDEAGAAADPDRVLIPGR